MTNIFDQMASDENPQIPSPESNLAGNIDGELSFGNIGESRQTSAEIKSIVQELLKHGYIEEANRHDLFRRIVVNEKTIGRVLEPLDLVLRIDSHRGVAFLAIAHDQLPTEPDDDGWSHPLVRKQRLTLEQSLLVAILRQSFVMHEQESGVGQSAATIAVDELLPTFMTYFGDSGSDSKNENRLLQLLDQLKAHGIVSEVDKKHEVTIRPLIAYLANPESLTALLHVLKEKREALSGMEKNN